VRDDAKPLLVFFLAERLGVATVPALVLVKSAHVVDRIDGRASAPTIEGMLAPHLGAAVA
jgi:thioredoxin-like negative regulator of GroEL